MQSSVESGDMTTDYPGNIVFVLPRSRYDNIRAVHKQAYSLSQAGHDVTLVVRDGDIEEYLGMQVVRATTPFENILRPILNLPTLFLQAVRLNADHYVVSNPDAIPLAIGLKLLRYRVIYGTDEDFSKRFRLREYIPKWLEPVLTWTVTRLERWLARLTDCVIVTQAQQPESLGGKTLLQPNAPLVGGPIIELAESVDNREQTKDTRLIYSGGITEMRGLFKMLDLMQALNQDNSCILDLLGAFESVELRKRAEHHPGWRFVNYLGPVSHAASLARIRDADIGLAILDEVADYPTTSITKLYEYMQFGLPFVASDFSAWRVTTATGAPGLYVNPHSAEELRASTLRLVTDPGLRKQMGRSGAHFIETEFNWEQVSKPFVATVERLLDRQAI